MKLKTFLLIGVIVSGLFGLNSLLLPSRVMILYGVEPTSAVCLLSQYSALGTLASGLIAWFFRNIELSYAKKTLIPALIITNLTGTIISVLGAMSGAMKAVWPTAGLYFFFALGYSYFLFFKKSQAD